MQKKILLAGALTAVLLMGASCQKAEENPLVNVPTNNAETDESEVSANVNADIKTETDVNTEKENKTEPVTIEPNTNESKIETKTFDISMSRFAFTPSVLNVNVGDTVVINATAKDTTHGISIPEFKVNLVVPKGTTQTSSFVADKAGTYTFRCSVYCGEGHSEMTGTLIVE